MRRRDRHRMQMRALRVFLLGLCVCASRAGRTRVERRRRGQRARADAADGLERLVLDLLRGQRPARRADRPGDGRQRDEGGRVRLRQHRRLLDGSEPRPRRQSGRRPDAVPGRDRAGRRVRARPRAQARHLRGRRHDHLRPLPRQLRARGPGRGHVRVVGRRLRQVRPLQHPVLASSPASPSSRSSRRCTPG